jgi:hypothetical protein
MKVTVTREMVGYALQQTNSNCAIALALKDANPDFIYPRITQESISVTDIREGKRYTFHTPDKMAKWIDKFDRGESPSPFSFELNIEEADKVVEVRRLQPSELAKQATRLREVRSGTRVAKPGVPRSARPLRNE